MILSLIKVNDQGWNISLFEDNTISNELCNHCKSVCCDAVELGCDHIDENVYLYCSKCLYKLIENNDAKCPINSHSNPIVTHVRSVRRHILQSTVVCPYSFKYKHKQQLKNDIYVHMIDTLPIAEKEGTEYKNDNEINDSNECKWKGTLNDLIKKHLPQCICNYDMPFTLNVKIKKLHQENNTLNKIIEDQKKQLNENIAMINTLKQKNTELKDLLDAQNSKLIEYKNQELEHKIVFHPNIENNHLFKISNNGKTVTWKGKLFSDPAWILCGDFCGKNDEITVYFEIPTTGNSVCYGFGFISKDFGKWINGYNEIKNGIVINGYGVIYSSDEFKINNMCKDITQLKQFKNLFDISLKINVIAISINMKKQIGLIWNDNKRNNVLKLALPETAAIALSFAGNESKKATIVNCV
eukprot:498464_1